MLLVKDESLLLFRAFTWPWDKKLLIIYTCELFIFLVDEVPVCNLVAFFIYLEAAVNILGEIFSLIFIAVSSFDDFSLLNGEFLGLLFDRICFGF